MKNYLTTILVSILGTIVSAILYTIFISFGMPLNASIFATFSVVSAFVLSTILPLFINSYYNSQEEAEGINWALQQSKLIRHAGATEKYERFRYAFSLTKDDLEAIYDILENQMIGNNNSFGNKFNTIIELRFKKHRRSVKGTLTEVISLDNGDDEEIQSLKIEMINKNIPRTAPVSQISIEFRKEAYASIRYYILGNDENQVSHLSKKLDRIIQRRIKSFPTTHIGLSLFFLLAWLSLELYFSYLLHVLRLSISIAYIFLAPIFLLLIISGATACTFCFPRYNFYWGDYLIICNRKQWWGKIIVNNVFGVALGILIGVLTGILANYFSAKIGIGQP